MYEIGKRHVKGEIEQEGKSHDKETMKYSARATRQKKYCTPKSVTITTMPAKNGSTVNGKAKA